MRPRAVAYHRYDRVYYRSRCDTCIRRGKRAPTPRPKWQQSGYVKKSLCDVCGFRARFAAQLMVYHADGNLNHTDPRNLKTVCRNCEVQLSRTDQVWRRGDLEEDC